MFFKSKLIFSMLFSVLLMQTAFAWDWDETNENLMSKGMWKDPDTGLIWMRCSLGQTWNGNGCDGQAKPYIWWDAIKTADKLNFAEQSDWRVPTTTELSSLLAGQVLHGKEGYAAYKGKDFELEWSQKSVIKQNDFIKNYHYSGVENYKTTNIFKPRDDGFGSYLSSSLLASYSGYVWIVLFDNGSVGYDIKKAHGYVRLVRSSQSLGGEAFSEFSRLAKTMVADEAIYLSLIHI